MLRASGTGTSAPPRVNRRSIESAIARDADSACSRASPGSCELMPTSVRNDRPLDSQYPRSAIALAVVTYPDPQSDPASRPPSGPEPSPAGGP
jgi:hypothetical protein